MKKFFSLLATLCLAAGAFAQPIPADPDFRVYLRADKNAEFRITKRAIRACAAAGVFDIIFGTYQAKDAAEEDQP